MSITYDNGTVSHSAAVAGYDDGLPIDPIRYYADAYKVDWENFKTNGEKNPEDPAGIASTTKTGNESTDESMTFNGHRITMTEVPAPPPPASGYNDNPRDNYEPRAYTIVERMPSFKGNINQWLAQNVNYPKDAAEKGIQGRVIVRFIVGKDGTVSDASIVRGVDPELDRGFKGNDGHAKVESWIQQRKDRKCLVHLPDNFQIAIVILTIKIIQSR